MNRLLIIIFSCLMLCSFNVMADNDISQPLHKYAEACVVMKQAIVSKDKDKLVMAMETMDEIDIDRGESVDMKVSSGECKRAEVLFFPEYADYLLLNDFEIANLDDVSVLRHTGPIGDVLAISNRCGKHSELQLDLDGEDEMEMFFLSASDINPEIKIYVGADGTPASIKPALNEGVTWWQWKMNKPDKFRIVVTNNSDTDIDFVIGLN